MTDRSPPSRVAPMWHGQHLQIRNLVSDPDDTDADLPGPDAALRAVEPLDDDRPRPNGFQERQWFTDRYRCYLRRRCWRIARRARSSRVYPASRLAALWSLSRLIWPQDHRAPGGLTDNRAVQFCPSLGHLIQQPRRDEGDQAAWWQRMNPEPAVPLALAPAGADFLEDQVLAVGVINRYRPVAAGPGPAAIGVQDTQPKGLFRYLPCARVGARIEGTIAPGELLMTQPRMDGELKAVRVGQRVAHGNGYLIGADQEQSGGGKPGDYTVWPRPVRIPGPVEPGRHPLRSVVKEAHATRLFRRSAYEPR